MTTRMSGLLFTLTLTITVMGGCFISSDGSADGIASCQGDHCVCTAAEACTHDCTPGAAECFIQGAQTAVDVTCDNNAECHVECAGSTSCAVECGNSAECHVTCPPTGCSVTGCIGSACVVSCGAVPASRTGTTASCP